MSDTTAASGAVAARSQGSPLVAWVIRDVSMALLFAWLMMAGAGWHAGAPSLASWIVVPSAAFVMGWLLCYALHEWGHLLGATVSGAHMPLANIRGLIIGYFDVRSHSKRQFLWLSWGGIAGYCTVMTIAAVVFFSGHIVLASAGFFVGTLAFVGQSLPVDLPVIIRVLRGRDLIESAARGNNVRIILSRMAISWSLLTAVVIAWNLY